MRRGVCFFQQRAREQVRAVGERLRDWNNPKVGGAIVKLQAPKLLTRVDGRSVHELHSSGGLLSRIEQEALAEIRLAQVHEYQKHNVNPFGWGACTSLRDLQKFMTDNRSHSDVAWVHVMLGHATSLGLLKVETGMEPEDHDDENEHLIVSTVPFQQWLAATCPKYRDKFLDGGLVPNVAAELDPTLPKSMRMSDFYSEKDAVRWLLTHNADEAFAKLCTHLYEGRSEASLKLSLEDDHDVFSAVQYFLQKLERSTTNSL